MIARALRVQMESIWKGIMLGWIMAALCLDARASALSSARPSDVWNANCGSPATRLLASLDARGDKAAAVIVCRLLDAPLGRELTGQWLRRGYRGSLRWADIPNSRLRVISGRTEIEGTGAFTDKHERIFLNRLYMRRPDATIPAADLAHELFGHVMTAKEAGPADADADAAALLDHSFDDELHASLIGWIVRLELGQPPLNREYRRYLTGETSYRAVMEELNESTADDLTLEEMARPSQVLRGRRERLTQLLRDRPQDAARLGPIIRRLDAELAVFERPENQAELRNSFDAARRSPFFLSLHERVEELARRLRGELGDRAGFPQ